MTTHKINPEMVRGVIPVLEKYPDIEILDITDEFIWLQHPDMPQISFTQVGLKCIADNKGIYNVGIFDIHRFKDMAIEWCAGKGWLISPSVISLDGLKIEIHKAHRHIDDNYSPRNWYMDSYLVEYFMHRDYPDKLSAELAAISFVWEQIQKEKNNER